MGLRGEFFLRNGGRIGERRGSFDGVIPVRDAGL